MPEHLRALVYLLLIASVVWAVAGHRPVGLPMADPDFSRRRNLWFAATGLAFLTHSFWVFILLLAVVLVLSARNERNPLALYLTVVYAIPPFWAEIPGALGIDHIISMDVPRLLALVVLLPTWFVLRSQPGVDRFGSLLPDRLLAGYLVLYFAAQVPYDSLTNSIRLGVIYPFLEVFLPYYVASRTIRSFKALRDVAATFAVVGMVLAGIAAFESLRSWLLYAQLDDALGTPWRLGAYLARGEGGRLRVQASLGHSLVLAYTLMVAMLLYPLLRRRAADEVPAGRKPATRRPLPPGADSPGMPRTAWLAGGGLLTVGVIAPLSRGPWVGLVVGCLVLALTGPRKHSRLLRIVLAVAAAGGVLYITPFGQNLVQYLPFIGTVDSFNVLYRQRLLDVSIEVILQRPFFGAYDFMANPMLEQMRQGEGIIDIVNSYLGVALRNGLVGLALFLGFSLSVVWGIVRGIRLSPVDSEHHRAGRALLAATAAAMVTIATLSLILTVSMTYFTVLGLGVGYWQMVLAGQPATRPVPAGRYAMRR